MIRNFFSPFLRSESTTVYDYFRVTATIADSRKSKGYRSTIYKCAQDSMVYYCEDGKKQSIFYEDGYDDLHINLLFKNERDASSFQNNLLNFRCLHPVFGNRINVDEKLDLVKLPQSTSRVLHLHYDGAESPILSLADIGHVLSSESESVSYDPVKALQSLEDITIIPGSKYYLCHLVSRKVKATKNNVNNCILDLGFFINTLMLSIPKKPEFLF